MYITIDNPIGKNKYLYNSHAWPKIVNDNGLYFITHSVKKCGSHLT